MLLERVERGSSILTLWQSLQVRPALVLTIQEQFSALKLSETASHFSRLPQ